MGTHVWCSIKRSVCSTQLVINIAIPNLVHSNTQSLFFSYFETYIGFIHVSFSL
ncbi:hypothetical protein HanIR_Chr16g0828541 [Helianthus annuus]|nr:hypothetical protein HanIR_Chr16g0828541 [Helianthus annuus]